MTDKKTLQARWTSDPNKVNAITQVLCAQGSKGLKGLVDMHEGRYDLRGFPLESKISSKDLVDIDWSYVTLSDDALIGMCRVKNCLFVGLSGYEPVIRGSYTGCDFSKSAVKIYELYGEFRDCSFREAKLANTRAYMSEFIRCDFGNCKAAGVDFANSKFTDCVFREGNFNEANFMRAELTGCDLQGMKAVGSTYEKTTIFRACKNLDPDMIKKRDTLYCSDRPKIIA
jgi:uncharacterized protein YjbI with pentapeptide repeats